MATDVLVGRQPILDQQKRTVAYELLFRSGTENRFDGSDGNTATQTVVSNAFLTLGSGKVLMGKRGFINFPRNCLVQDTPLLLPPDHIVVEILEDVQPDPEVLDACTRLKRAGYTIALDDVADPAATLPFLGYVDIVKLELPAMTPPERKAACDFFMRKGIQILAEKVETLEDFQSALASGCTLFQGYFFARPEIVNGKQVPVSKTACLRLIREVQHPELDFDKLASIVRLDVGLTRKLLCLVNSAACGAREHIDSVARAFVRLGETNSRRWVTVAALPALAVGHPDELVKASLVRARFCERAAGHFAKPTSGFFLAGLLSLLDVMVSRPLDEVIGDMALDSMVVDSILGKSDGRHPMRVSLELAMAFERANFDQVEQLSAESGITVGAALELYLDAVAWADSIPR